MKKGILATKVGMTQIFQEDGTLIPVTVLQAGPCVVTQIKTEENDGYKAVQVGFVDKKDKIINRDKAGKKEVIHRHGVNKALKGHFDKAGVTSKRFLREFKFDNTEEYALGNEIKASPALPSSCPPPSWRLAEPRTPRWRFRAGHREIRGCRTASSVRPLSQSIWGPRYPQG